MARRQRTSPGSKQAIQLHVGRGPTGSRPSLSPSYLSSAFELPRAGLSSLVEAHPPSGLNSSSFYRRVGYLKPQL
jgi:hypothetical protein